MAASNDPIRPLGGGRSRPAGRGMMCLRVSTRTFARCFQEPGTMVWTTTFGVEWGACKPTPASLLAN
jgi:hypothetical protein